MRNFGRKFNVTVSLMDSNFNETDKVQITMFSNSHLKDIFEIYDDFTDKLDTQEKYLSSYCYKWFAIESMQNNNGDCWHIDRDANHRMRDIIIEKAA